MDEKNKPGIDLGNPLQIGLVVKDARRTAELLSNLLGIGPFRFIEWPSDRPDMRSFYKEKVGNFQLLEAFANFGNIELELIEPVSGQSGYAEYLAEHGEGIHHLLFEVPDLEEAVEWFTSQGLQVKMGGTGNRPGFTWLHIDTLPIFGWSLELRNKVVNPDGKPPIINNL